MTWGFTGIFSRACQFPNGEAVAVSPAGNAVLRYNATTNQFEASLNGAAYAAFGNPADISIADNTALAFRVHEGANNYITVATTNGSEAVTIAGGANNPKAVIGAAGSALGFFAGAGAVKQTVTGAKGGNAALTSLMAALVAYGFVLDTTS